MKEGGGEEGECEREHWGCDYATALNIVVDPHRSGVGGSSDGQDEPSRIVLPPETGEQPSLSSGLGDASWLNRWRPESLYSIIGYE